MDESGNHKQAEQRERIRWIVSILIPLLCALLSFCVIAKYTSSPTMKINAHAIQSLDDKKTTALELTAAATASCAVLNDNVCVKLIILKSNKLQWYNIGSLMQ